jgi:chromosome segregation ATPase
MADIGSLDLVKVFTLMGTTAGAIRTVLRSYQKAFKPEGSQDSDSSGQSTETGKRTKERQALPDKGHSPAPHAPEEEDDELSHAKICDLERQIQDLKLDAKKMHLENLDRNAEVDRRYQNLTARYQEIDRKIEEVGKRLTELKDEQIEGLAEKLGELKHDLRQDLRDSRESLREVTQTLNRALAQIKAG